MSPMVPAAVPLGALWLPVVLSAVFSFVGSSVIWMVFKYHMAQWKMVPDEVGLMEAMRKAGLTGGQYMFPHMDPKPADRAAARQTWEERYATGPVGVVLLGTPGTMRMGKMMAQTLVFFLVVSFVVAYIASHALAHRTSRCSRSSARRRSWPTPRARSWTASGSVARGGPRGSTSWTR